MLEGQEHPHPGQARNPQVRLMVLSEAQTTHSPTLSSVSSCTERATAVVPTQL